MRFYHIGKGLPPFNFEYSGTEYIIYPSDQKWERHKVAYEVEVNNGKKRTFHKFEWKLAENQSGRRPHNHLDLTDDQTAFLNTGKWAAIRESHIKTSEELGKQL